MALDEVIDAWLGTLPKASYRLEENLVIEGFLLRAPSENIVRIVCGDMCLDLDADGLLEIHRASLPPGIYQRVGIPIRASFRTPVQLFAVNPSDVYAPLLYEGQKPFAILTRPDHMIGPRRGWFDVIEREFLRARGVDWFTNE